MSAPLYMQLGPQRVPYTGTRTTRVFGVIGHPVRHSLSPRFQGAALRSLGLDAVYLTFDVEPSELAACVRRMREHAVRGTLAGVNVTLPHKSAIRSELDDLDGVARVTGAVNTIQFESPAPGAVALRGFNTDVAGLIQALADAGVSLRGVPVVVVGAGGAARAAVVAALREGASEVRVANRSVARAREMLDALSASWRGRLPQLTCAALVPAAGALLDGARVLVQATSLGLRAADPSPLDLAAAPPELFVLETIYNPAETTLLRAARARGLRARNGLGMLVHQGAAALRIWTDRQPPLDVMRRSRGLD
ncbi:MAG: shikimate dehydrogenase family protein [Candidatus Krumholzibacteriia bacterium]